MLGSASALTEEHKAAAVTALGVAGYADFDEIGFSRTALDTATRGAFIAKGEFCIFVAPDEGDVDVRKAIDEDAMAGVKRTLELLHEQVATPTAAPVIVQTQAEFDATPAPDETEKACATPPEEPDHLAKSLASLREFNASFKPLPVAPASSYSALEDAFLKSAGASRFTPALRVKYAQSLGQLVDQQLAALRQAGAAK